MDIKIEGCAALELNCVSVRGLITKYQELFLKKGGIYESFVEVMNIHTTMNIPPINIVA